MNKYFLCLFLFCNVLCAGQQIQIFGWLETISFPEHKLKATAKLDSGAKTSSIHAENVKVFKEGKIKKVQYDLIFSNGKTATMTSKVHRVVNVKSSNGLLEERVSVKIPIKIGFKKITLEFTLADRTSMNYPILLGRKAIAKIGLLDCSKTFLSKKGIYTQLSNES